MGIENGTDSSTIISQALARLVPSTVGQAATDSREDIIVRYSIGTGRFSADRKYITLDMTQYTLDDQADGKQLSVWELDFATPQDLLRVPPDPALPMNEPKGPVPHLSPLVHTKATWTFGDRSSVTVLGPAMSHLVPLSDGSSIFLVSTAQVLSNGTGRYEGASGLSQSLSATLVPAGVDFLRSQTESFAVATLDTFRVIRRRYASAEISSAYPFKTKQMEVLGTTMSYIDEGKGKPIVFLHGNPTWSYLWRNVIPHLTDLGRCIAPDLIGMGRSAKPDIKRDFFVHFKHLETLLEKLQLDQITLVIHDWGSALGFHYANLHQERIRGVVFMEALVKPYPTWDEFPARSAPPQLREAFKAYRSDKGYDLIVKQNLFMVQTKALAGRPLTQEENAFYDEPFPTEKSREVILDWPRQLPIAGDPADVNNAVASYTEFLKKTKIPKLLLYTLPGAVLLQDDVTWCQQNLSNLETVNLDPSNGPVPIHLLQEKYPHKMGKIIADWLSGS